MTDESNKAGQTPIDLEFVNKQRVVAQTREINRGLTRLKKISHPPPADSPLKDYDKTGSFIVVPIGELLTKNIETAHTEAVKECDTPDTTKSKIKKWFRWKD